MTMESKIESFSMNGRGDGWCLQNAPFGFSYPQAGFTSTSYPESGRGDGFDSGYLDHSNSGHGNGIGIGYGATYDSSNAPSDSRFYSDYNCAGHCFTVFASIRRV